MAESGNNNEDPQLKMRHIVPEEQFQPPYEDDDDYIDTAPVAAELAISQSYMHEPNTQSSGYANNLHEYSELDVGNLPSGGANGTHPNYQGVEAGGTYHNVLSGAGYSNAAFTTDDNDEKASSSHPTDDSLYVDISDELPAPTVEGIPLKAHQVRKRVRQIHNCYLRQIVFSIGRNICCWTFLICFFVFIANASAIADDQWTYDGIAVLSVLLGLGLIGTLFHIWRGYNDLSYNKPTIVARLLRSAMVREEFTKLMQNRQFSAPEVFMQVTLKSGAQGNQEWSRSGNRQIMKEISYRGWADQSMSALQLKWPELDYIQDTEDSTGSSPNHCLPQNASWVVASKDFRCLDEAAFNSFQTEVAAFRQSTGYNDNPYFMDFEYILQWKDCEPSWDAEPILVLDSLENRGIMYIPAVYTLSWLTGFDSIFRIVFHFTTKKLDNYYIVKFIER